MKKILFIAGVIILAGVIFFGGLIAGTSLDFMNELLQVSLLEQQMIEARKTFVQISYIDEGKIDEAKSFMNAQLDTSIVMIGTNLGSYPNQETKEHAQALLVQIAEHRTKFSVERNKEKGYAQEILDHALESE